MEQLTAGRKQDVMSLLFGLAFLGGSVLWLVDGADFWGVAGFAAFVVIGLGALVRGIRPFLAGSRIGEPVISTSATRVPVGGAFDVSYQQTWKRAVEVNRVVAQLVLRETVRYTSGTRTHTVTHEEVVQRWETPGRRFEPGEVFREDYSFRIPPDGMHTFAASDNRIEWFVKLSAELPRWADLHRYYEVTAVPELVG